MEGQQLKQHIADWKQKQLEQQKHFAELDEKRVSVVRWKVATNQPLSLFDNGLIPTKRLKILYQGIPVKRIFIRAGKVEVLR
jgi:hypothetical protein